MNNHLALIVPSSSYYPAELTSVSRKAGNDFLATGEYVTLRYIHREDLPIKDRYPDGHLPSGTAVYLISQDEYDKYIRLDAERKSEDKRRKEAEVRPIMKQTVELARKQGGAMTPEEALKAARQYNERHNDGGYGYVPHYITTAELAHAEKWLADHPEN